MSKVYKVTSAQGGRIANKQQRWRSSTETTRIDSDAVEFESTSDPRYWLMLEPVLRNGIRIGYLATLTRNDTRLDGTVVYPTVAVVDGYFSNRVDAHTGFERFLAEQDKPLVERQDGSDTRYASIRKVGANRYAYIASRIGFGAAYDCVCNGGEPPEGVICGYVKTQAEADSACRALIGDYPLDGGNLALHWHEEQVAARRVARPVTTSKAATIEYLYSCEFSDGSEYGQPSYHYVDAWRIVKKTAKFVFVEDRAEGRWVNGEIVDRGSGRTDRPKTLQIPISIMTDGYAWVYRKPSGYGFWVKPEDAREGVPPEDEVDTSPDEYLYSVESDYDVEADEMFDYVSVWRVAQKSDRYAFIAPESVGRWANGRIDFYPWSGRDAAGSVRVPIAVLTEGYAQRQESKCFSHMPHEFWRDPERAAALVAPRTKRPTAVPCLLALGLTTSPCTKADIKAAYRRLVKTAHPDHGGDSAAFIALQANYEKALRLA